MSGWNNDDMEEFISDMLDLKDDLLDMKDDLISNVNSSNKSKPSYIKISRNNKGNNTCYVSWGCGPVTEWYNSNKNDEEDEVPSGYAGSHYIYGGETMINPNSEHIKNTSHALNYVVADFSVFCISLVGKFLLNVFRDDIIIGWSIKGFNFLNIVVLLIMGISSAKVILKFKRMWEQKRVLKAPKKQVSLSMKKNISKEDLMNKLNELLSSWVDMDGEEGISYPYVQRAKKQLEDLDKIYSTLSLLVDNNDESSLYEVFNVIKTTEEQIIKNIVSMINHIKVELSIDGYDRTNIEEYLDNNDIMIKECSKLLKAALLYMDGKAGAKGIQEYIESMVETLNKLKKES